MEKSIRSMTLEELRSYSVKHKLSPVGTGRDGAVLKRDLLQVCEEHKTKTRAAYYRESAKHAEEYMSYLNTVPGRVELYNIELNGLHKKLVQLVQIFIAAKNKGEIVSVEHVRYILRECKYFQQRGITDFDHIIPSLVELSLEECIL